MSRTGSLIVGAFLFAAAAAGVLVWTNFLDLSGAKPRSSASQSDPLQTDSGEAEFMALINDAAARGGFAATFADSANWQVTEGHRLERFSLTKPNIVMARLSSAVPRRDDMLLQGLSIELPIDFAQRVNGKQIEIGVVARVPQSNGATEISLVYATRQAGNSGWRPLSLGPQFALHSFKFDVPKVDLGYTAQPIVVMHADSAGQGRAVEMLGIYVKEAQ